jgi:hypothetical protein
MAEMGRTAFVIKLWFSCVEQSCFAVVSILYLPTTLYPLAAVTVLLPPMKTASTILKKMEGVTPS